jgi:hypothetical protein
MLHKIFMRKDRSSLFCLSNFVANLERKTAASRNLSYSDIQAENVKPFLASSLFTELLARHRPRVVILFSFCVQTIWKRRGAVCFLVITL